MEVNPYVHELSLEHVAVILDPSGDAAVAVVNYTPVHILLHALAWQAFQDDVRGHHLVNLLFHVTASVLLIALLLRSGVPKAGAVFGGAIFLLHPANVEAVAWISQLKSSSSMTFALAALLAFRSRPGLGSALFALALLAKPTAAFALPVAVLLAWAGGERPPWRWFALCAALFVAYAVVEFTAHQRSGAAEAALYETPLVLVRTVAAFAMRYLVMATTTLGLSAFHEPEPAQSPLDPWWLGSLAALGLLGWRFAVVLRRRAPEAAYWAWALISFGPVSQVFPFLYPLADRYLYFILPGLIGGALLAGAEVLERLPRALAARRGAAPRDWAPRVSRVAAALGIAALALCAVRANGRAAVWHSDAALVSDAAANYPDGVSAHLQRGRRAAQYGDVDAAVASVRAAAARGYNRFDQLQLDPGFAPVRDHLKFRAVLREIAGRRIELTGQIEDPTPFELRVIAGAHFVRGEYAQAAVALERAIALGGPLDATLRAELKAVQSHME